MKRPSDPHPVTIWMDGILVGGLYAVFAMTLGWAEIPAIGLAAASGYFIGRIRGARA